APTITTLDALMLHPNQGWRGTRSRLRFSTAALQRQSSRLFAVEYGVNIIRALRTFVVAALMATTAWTSTRAAERVDLLLVLAWGDPTRPGTVQSAPARDRCFGGWRQQFRPRPCWGAGCDDRQGHHDQRARHPDRAVIPLLFQPHQPSRRACKLL